MRNKINILSGALVVSLCASTSSFAGGGFCPISPDSAWQAVHQETTAGLNAAFDVNKNLILAQMTLAYQRMMSAVKVDTSQQSIDGQKVSTAIKKSDEALANVMTQTDVNKQIAKAHADFGPDGLSVNACGSAQLIDSVTSALSVYGVEGREYITPARVNAAPGSTTTPSQAIEKSLENHRSKYCTESEAKAGLCAKAGSDAGADVNIFTILDPGADEEAKDAFVNNLVGLPLPKPTEAEAKTPRGSLMMAEAMRAEAIRSPALVSIGILRAQNSGGSSSETELSFNAALDALMDQYGGGSGYDQWAKEVVTKNERGLLQELNKLRAINLKLRSNPGESDTRIAAIFAGLLAAETQQ